MTDRYSPSPNAPDGSGTGTPCGSGQVGDRCDAGETYVIQGDEAPAPPVGGAAELADVSGSGGGKHIAIAGPAAPAVVIPILSVSYARGRSVR